MGRRGDTMSQAALNAAFRAPGGSEETRSGHGLSGAAREIELSTDGDEELVLDTDKETERHLPSVGDEIELLADDSEKIKLDTEKKIFAPGMKGTKPVQIRPSKPSRKAA